MLSSFERRMWDEIQQQHPAGAEDPAYTRPPPEERAVEQLPAVLVGGMWAAILLVLFGAVVAGLAVATATAAGLVLWRARSRRRRAAPRDDRLPGG
ncbi:hypothetical protein [Trujillonella endophytica]|uniref:DUF3040 domain-containing protein n=1 Tax=Trujillonella endophytica TaxID=673521 RepID=A0A1H8VIL5_9ACTN|nr:hypothetical protein [Trujillella endophytica]SEP15153.1 hypothetical protein SAMN05660991_03572 [Trujillella endophytica]